MSSLASGLTTVKDHKKIGSNSERATVPEKVPVTSAKEAPSIPKESGKSAHTKVVSDESNKKVAVEGGVLNLITMKQQPGKTIPEKKPSTKAPIKNPDKPSDEKQDPASDKAVKVSEAPKPQRTAASAQNMGNAASEDAAKSVDNSSTDTKSASPHKASASPKSPATSPKSAEKSQSSTPPKAATEATQKSPPKTSSESTQGPPTKASAEAIKVGATSKAGASPPKASAETKPTNPPSPSKISAEIKQAPIPKQASEVKSVIPPAGAVQTKPTVLLEKNTPETKTSVSSSPNVTNQAKPIPGEKLSTAVTGVVPLGKVAENESSGKKVEKPLPTAAAKETAEGNVGQTSGKADDSLKEKPKDAEVSKGVDASEKSSDANTSNVITKQTLRVDIWKKMKSMGQLEYNLSSFYRIPHFKGDVLAIERLKSLEVFKKAKIIKVNLDKAQENLRLMCIEEGKELIVGCPGLREAVFLHVRPPLQPSKYANRQAATSAGIARIGTALDFSSQSKADLVIVASVVVDKRGNRIGKGEGFSDLEYALLKKVDGVTENAPVVTVVHDLQVYDSLPDDIFKPHDVAADIIVTPNEVIEVEPKKEKPGLIWNLLSQRRVNCIPLIKNLLDVEKNSNEIKIELKDVDTDTEEMEELKRRKKYFVRRRYYSASSRNGMGSPNGGQFNNNGHHRRMSAPFGQQQYGRAYSAPPQAKNFRTMNVYPNNRMTYNRGQQPPQLMQQNQTSPRRPMQNRRRSSGGRSQWRTRAWRKGGSKVDFSIKVEGLSKTHRVRNLKTALYERGVRPRDISWWPKKGTAILHFAKERKQTEEVVLPPTSAEGILASLQNFAVANDKGDPAILKCCQAIPLKRVNFAAPEVQPICV